MGGSKLLAGIAFLGGLAAFFFFLPFGLGNAITLGLCAVLVTGGFSVIAVAAWKSVMGDKNKPGPEGENS